MSKDDTPKIKAVGQSNPVIEESLLWLKEMGWDPHPWQEQAYRRVAIQEQETPARHRQGYRTGPRKHPRRKA